MCRLVKPLCLIFFGNSDSSGDCGYDFYDDKYSSKIIGESRNTYFINEDGTTFDKYNPAYVNFTTHLTEWNNKLQQ